MKNNSIFKKDYEELKKEILTNNGMTCNSDLVNAHLKSGFVVSIEGYEYTTHNIDNVINKMIEYSKIIKNKDNYFVGVWVDTQDNNLIYVDISKVVKTRRDAENLAKKNKQKAYFDIVANNSIYLSYNVEYYSIYKGDEFIADYYSFRDIPSTYRKNKKDYEIIKDIINIKDLAL